MFVLNIQLIKLKTEQQIIATAVETIKIEKEAIEAFMGRVDKDFVNSVNAVFNCNGRVVLTGIGKSANIANKIVATLNSTGTPAIFMHAADAVHGDLGLVQKEDIVIVISKSGNTPEIKSLVPLINNFGNQIIAMVGDRNSYLASHSNFIIDCSIEKEACPYNLAPTTSTTVQLVAGDTLAMCLLDMRGFTSSDFARFHPGGALGKRLLLKVEDIVLAQSKPEVTPQTSIKDVIVTITSNRLGATAVVENNHLIGIITDGDIRRMLQQHDNIAALTAADVMSPNPKIIHSTALAVEGLKAMKDFSISQLIVMKDDTFYGILHMHDLMREGIIV